MEKCYRVIVLIQEAPGTFTARIEKVPATSRGDAVISVLMTYAKDGLNLNLVKKTSTKELPVGRNVLAALGEAL
jgi:hypothetical protein